MSVELGVTLVFLGIIGGTLSGLLGIGGGLVIVPLLLYVPAWLGLGEIDIRTAAAIAVVQVCAATASGTIAHGRHGRVHARLAVTMSLASTSGALAGGFASAYVPGEVLLTFTAVLATVSALLMAAPPPRIPDDGPSHPSFNLLLTLVPGFIIGVVIGLNGSGAFLMAPALIFLLRIPTRVALATVLAIGFPTALAAVIGKVATGQVPLWTSVVVVLGAIPGAQLGSAISVRLPARMLRLIYGALILSIAIGLWYDVFHTN